MNILAVNTWFVTLIKQFFFSLDQVVFNFISEIYDLLISISRTSILSQADISEMADKIYALLTVFMVFKVTLSLITYVVNPDDFADKSKGLSKLGTNIIISLSLLILTPYIFSYAFELQTIILEDNSLAKLIFETEGTKSNDSIINTAGDEIAFTAMSAFFTPNVSITKFQNCVELYDEEGFNDNCSGVIKESGSYVVKKEYNGNNTMANLTSKDGKFKEKDLINYVVGVENKNLGLMFRQDLAVATVSPDGEQEYVMEYKFVFSTVVGVIIILLLLTYCMDVALRSIKLSFLQLIAPIPILSYVDPKSGKDGLFKKWYDMCFKTYLSLFVRLLALYFAIYIIGRVGKMVDIVDGSSVTDTKIKIFVIIGALMFAKQLPKMLEGLGIKLDGDGKFTLNPLKKFEEGALGGKNITGMARGALVGTAGMLSGAGAFAGISGAWKGLTSGKGWKETGKATTEMNRKMRQAKLDGSSFGGRLGARFTSATGLMSQSERIAAQKHDLEEGSKRHDDVIKANQARKKEIEQQQKLAMDEQDGTIRKSKIIVGSSSKAKDTMNEKIKTGKGVAGQNYNTYQGLHSTLSQNIGKTMTFDSYTLGRDSSGKEVWQKETVTRAITQADIDNAKLHFDQYADDIGWRDLANEMMAKADIDAETGKVDWEKADKFDSKMKTNLEAALEDIVTVDPECETIEDAVKKVLREGNGDFGAGLKKIIGVNAGAITKAEQQKRRIEEKDVEELDKINKTIERETVAKEQFDEQIRNLRTTETRVKADENAVK